MVDVDDIYNWYNGVDCKNDVICISRRRHSSSSSSSSRSESNHSRRSHKKSKKKEVDRLAELERQKYDLNRFYQYFWFELINCHGQAAERLRDEKYRTQSQ